MSWAKIMRSIAKTTCSVLTESFPDKHFVGCEIGVWEGYTSEYWLKNIDSLFLYMIDPWLLSGIQMRAPDQSFVDQKKEKSVQRTEFAKHRRKIIEKPSVEASEDFEDESLDFVFIELITLMNIVGMILTLGIQRLEVEGFYLGMITTQNTKRKVGGESKKLWMNFANLMVWNWKYSHSKYGRLKTCEIC
jgi:hypothetical protein